MQKITTFLAFFGQAEEAMNFYVSLFDGSEVLRIERYGSDAGVNAGKVIHATFSLSGQEFACIDSPPVHEWTFTPAISLWVTCHSEEEIDQLHASQRAGGSSCPWALIHSARNLPGSPTGSESPGNLPSNDISVQPQQGAPRSLRGVC